MCRVLQVARSGFYQWLHKPLSDRAIEDQRLLGLIRDSHTASGGVYGSPRVFGDLREAGETCGRHRVARLMRSHKIRAIRGYKAPRHIAGRPSILAPNRQMSLSMYRFTLRGFLFAFSATSVNQNRAKDATLLSASASSRSACFSPCFSAAGERPSSSNALREPVGPSWTSRD